MRSRVALLTVVLALGCRPEARPPRRVSSPPPALVAPPAPPPAWPAAWTETFSLRSAPGPKRGLPDVTVHAPAGFDPRQPLHLVIFAHSMGSYALQWVASGPAAVVPGRRPMIGWGLDARHDLARTRTLLVAPQFTVDPRRTWGARFASRGALRTFLAELLGEALAPRLGGPRAVDDVASITLVGSSAGGYTAESILAHSDLADRVRNVVLLDAFYMPPDAFAAWLLRAREGAPRRFVSVHGGGHGTAENAAALAARVRDRVSVTLNPRGALADAVREHRVTLAVSALEHVHIGTLLYDKILAGLDLPRLPPDPTGFDAKALAAPPALRPRPLRVGERVAEALGAGDARLRDGAAADDYVLALREGERVVVRAVGGRAVGDAHAPLDVALRLELDGRVVAEDDDSGGGFRARLVYTAARRGTYTLRVTTHGPWLRPGPYTVEAEAPSP